MRLSDSSPGQLCLLELKASDPLEPGLESSDLSTLVLLYDQLQ